MASIIAVAAFAAGGFVMSPVPQAIAAVIATDVQCTGCIGTADLAGNAVTSAKIKDGEIKTDDIAASAVGSLRIKDNDVKAQDIAPNGVGTSEIADGSITYSDLSRSLVAIEHRDDCNCGGTGWDPNGTGYYEQIVDSRITGSSVVSATLINVNNIACGTAQLQSGSVMVSCNREIPQGSAVNYAIFNK